MSNFFSGMTHGFAGLLGLGQMYDPLGDLSSQLSSKIAEFNSITAQYSLASAVAITNRISTFEQYMNTQGAVARKQVQVTTDMLAQSLENDNLFIIYLYVLIFIVIIYLIIRK